MLYEIACKSSNLYIVILFLGAIHDVLENQRAHQTKRAIPTTRNTL